LIHIHRFVSLPRRRAFVSSLFPYTTLFRSRRGRYVRRTRDPIERFEEKYIPEPNTGCWLWVGALGTGAGYPKFWDGVQIRDGHRWAYEAFKGDPHGYVVKHECDTPSCVNP